MITDPPHRDGPAGSDESPAEVPPAEMREQTPGSAADRGPGSFDDWMEKARRLVALELDLAETRRRLAEDNLAITEAQLALAEEQLAELKAENERLIQEIAALEGR